MSQITLISIKIIIIGFIDALFDIFLPMYLFKPTNC